MMDRAMQALHLLALDSVAETTADKNSSGFVSFLTVLGTKSHVRDLESGRRGAARQPQSLHRSRWSLSVPTAVCGTRWQLYRAGPACRSNSMASIGEAASPALRRCAAARSDNQKHWPRITRKYG